MNGLAGLIRLKIVCDFQMFRLYELPQHSESPTAQPWGFRHNSGEWNRSGSCQLSSSVPARGGVDCGPA